MTLLFLLLLLLFLALFCLPRRMAPVNPPPDDTEDSLFVDNRVPHTGDVQVLLEWESRDDVDLHVTDPSGESIYFGHRMSASGGQLDIDANFGSRMMRHPKENIYWPEGGAPSGTYEVEVQLFNWRTNEEVPFRVMVKYGDQEEHYEGILSEENQVIQICRFTLDLQ